MSETINPVATSRETPASAAPDDADRSGLDEAHIALDAALNTRALEPVLLDVRGMCSYANYLLILSGRSDRQVEAIAESINIALKARGEMPLGVEGKGTSGQWVLLDFGDLVTHVFHHPLREHYDLEGLWFDAPRIALDIPDEARASVDDSY